MLRFSEVKQVDEGVDRANELNIFHSLKGGEYLARTRVRENPGWERADSSADPRKLLRKPIRIDPGVPSVTARHGCIEVTHPQMYADELALRAFEGHLAACAEPVANLAAHATQAGELIAHSADHHQPPCVRGLLSVCEILSFIENRLPQEARGNSGADVENRAVAEQVAVGPEVALASKQRANLQVPESRRDQHPIDVVGVANRTGERKQQVSESWSGAADEPEIKRPKPWVENKHCVSQDNMVVLSSEVRSRSLTASALSGGLWTAVQTVANRVVSLVGALVTTHFIDPGALGVASIALGVQAIVTLLQPFTLGDVLLARPTVMETVARRATLMGVSAGLATGLVGILAAPAVAGWFDDDRLWIACILVCLRPLAESFLVLPQARLRRELRFKEISIADGCCFAGATLLSVAMAWAGCGYMSLILPQLIFAVLRTGIYGILAGRLAIDRDRGSSADVPSTWVLWREYLLSGFGQYVHGGLIFATPLVIGYFCSEASSGHYSLAFSLAASVNGVVAVAMGLVLQPIFAQMGTDRERQSTAFLRACSTIAAIAMPLSMLQGLLAPLIFQAFLDDKWSPAATMAQLLSVGQGFYFAVNPAMGLLKAQGRFGTFLAWQAVQFIVVLSTMSIIGAVSDDGAVYWIVFVSSAYHLISSPFGVWICVRANKTPMQSVAVFASPVLACSVGLFAGLILQKLVVNCYPPDAQASRWRELLDLALLPAIAAPASFAAIRVLSPEVWRDLRMVAGALASKCR